MVNPFRFDIYLTVKEAAEALGMSKEEVKELVKQKQITPYRVKPDDTKYLIPSSEIQKFLNKPVH